MKAFAWFASVFAPKTSAVSADPVSPLSTEELQVVAGGLPRVGGLDIEPQPMALVALVSPSSDA